MNRSFTKAAIGKLAVAALFTTVALIVTGCGAAISPAGPDTTLVRGGSISGMAHGGQQGIVGGAVQLWAAGNTGYGTGATSLVSNAVFTGTNTGSAVASPVMAWSIASVSGKTVATFTAANSYTAGEAVTLSGFGTSAFFNGQTVTVLSTGLSGAQFEANFVGSVGSATEAGSATPAVAGAFNITEDYTCPSSSLVYLTITGGDAGGGVNNAIKLMTPLGLCSGLTSSTFISVNEVTTAAAAYALSQYYTTAGGIGAPNTTQAQVGLTNAFGTVNNLVNTASGAAVISATLPGAGGTITTTPEASKLYLVADILASCVNSGTTGGGTVAFAGCPTLFADVAGPTATDTMQAAVDMNLNPIGGSISGLYGLQTGFSPYNVSAQQTQPNDWTIGILYSAPASTTSLLLNAPIDLAVDSGGNVWVINGSTNATSEALSELSPTGTPLLAYQGTATAGATSLISSTPRNVAIDTNNNVWVASSSGSAYVYEYTTAAALNALNLGSSSYGLAIDGSNDVFVSQESSGATIGVNEFPGGVLATGNRVEYPQYTTAAQGEYLAVDTSGNVWLSSGSGISTTNATVLELSGMNAASCTTFPCTSSNDSSLGGTYASFTVGSEPWSPAAGPSGAIWFPNSASGANTVSLLPANTPEGSSTSLSRPFYSAVDGAGNAWFGTSKSGSPAAIAELSSTGAVLSPNSGTIGYPHVGMSTTGGVAIDPSGNIWSANNVGTAATDENSVFEIVGTAAPTVTPIALALKNTTANNGHGVGQQP
jgi:hypothetical protein